MLLPLLVVGVLALVALRQAAAAFSAGSAEIIEEVALLTRLRSALLRADALPPEYVRAPDPRVAARFLAAGRAVDAALADLDATVDTPTERASVDAARRAWQRAFARAWPLLTGPLPPTPVRGYPLFGIHEAVFEATSAADRATQASLQELAAEAAGVRRQFRLTFLAFLAVFACSVVAGLWLSARLRTALRDPLVKLEQAAQRLSSGDLSHRVQLDRGDEVGRVAESFNTMVERLARSHEELRQSQRMEAVGQLAGGLAHDFGNLLVGIRMSAELLSEELERRGEKRPEIDSIQRAADRGARLIYRLMACSRSGQLEPRLLDLNAAVTDLQDLLGKTIGANIRLTSSLAPDLWLATMDPGEWDRVLLNLALNARDAMPDGGTLTITTANVAVGPGEHHPRLPPGRYVTVSVSDTGHGMSEQVAARVFDPLFTTKPAGKGTGLGLATVRRIVAHAGGDVSLTTAPGQGSTFTVWLPAAEAEISAPVPRPDPAPGARGSGTVLVVDDDAEVRDVLSRVLSLSGYTVLTAGTGQEALEVCQRCGPGIEVLVVDVIMPELDGSQLVRRLRSRLPGLKVVLMSAYGDPATADADAVLRKPFTRSELLAAIEQVGAADRAGGRVDTPAGPP